MDCGYRQLGQAHLRQRGQQLGEIDPKSLRPSALLIAISQMLAAL
jgi:hypothetical protein